MITILACDTNNIKELLEAAGYTVTTATVGTLTVYKITVNSKTVQILNPGMTKVEVAKAITTLNYAESAPSQIIVTGNCASICPVRIGTMAISTSAVQHDVDFSAMNLRRGTLPVVHETVFTANSDLITAAISAWSHPSCSLSSCTHSTSLTRKSAITTLPISCISPAI